MIVAYIALDVMLIFLLVELLSAGFVGIVSGKYYDEQLKRLGKSLPIVVRVACTKRCARAIAYLLMVLLRLNLLRDKIKSPFWKKQLIGFEFNFGNIDYRELARKRDWVMAILFWGSAACFVLLGTIMCITSAILGVH
jgi:hypothetical protein